MTGLLSVVVSGFGYRTTHVAQVRSDDLEPASWPSPAHQFTGIRTPVAGICGTSVRSVQPVAVVMKEGTPVRCRVCRLLTAERGLEICYPAVHAERKAS